MYHLLLIGVIVIGVRQRNASFTPFPHPFVLLDIFHAQTS